jgi:hypothetical protein
MSKIQNSDVKSQAELVSAGATAAQLINDTKIYVTANSLNKRLDEAITAGDIGGGSTTGTVFELKATELISGWSTGNNAAPLGGGSLAGTFVKDSSTPLNGTDSYVYTQAGGSLNDYIISPAQAVARRFRGTTCTLYFPYQYDGNGSDVSVVIYDATNAVVLTQNSLTVLPASNGVTSQYQLPIIIPATCASIRVGFQVGVANSGKILRFDDMMLSSNNALNSNLPTVTAWQTATFPTNWTNVTVTGVYRRIGDSMSAKVRIAATGAVTGGALAITLPTVGGVALQQDTTKTPGFADNHTYTSSGWMRDDGTASYTAISVAYNNATSVLVTFGTAASQVSNTNPMTWVSGDRMNVSWEGMPISNWANSTQVVSSVETFSTDINPLTYFGSATYTLSTLANAPVGSFITFTYASTSNTRTQTNAAAPTQTTADMAINGIQLFTRAYNAASTAASPAAVAIQIGKGLKGVSRNLYQSTGKVNAGSIDIEVHSATNQNGIALKDYNEQTGILMLDAGYCHVTTITTSNLLFSDLSSATSGYVVINASKNPALTGITSSVCAGRVVATSGQTITDTGAKVQWNSSPTFSQNISWDSANHRFICQSPGIYEVVAFVSYASATYTAGISNWLQIYKNGTSFSRGNGETGPSATFVQGSSISDRVSLVAGDFVEIYALNQKPTATALSTVAGECTFSIAKIGGLG